MNMKQHPIFQIGRRVWLIPKGEKSDLNPKHIYRGIIQSVSIGESNSIIFHGRVDYENVKWSTDTYNMFQSEQHAFSFISMTKP